MFTHRSLELHDNAWVQYLCCTLKYRRFFSCSFVFNFVCHCFLCNNVSLILVEMIFCKVSGSACMHFLLLDFILRKRWFPFVLKCRGKLFMLFSFPFLLIYFSCALTDHCLKESGNVNTFLMFSRSLVFKQRNCFYYTVKKRFASFPSPAGMSLPNSPWAGIMTS